MAVNSESLQLISRLTPLADVLTAIDAMLPVGPRAIDLAAATGRVLASDAVARTRPAAPMALIDGWAVTADLTLDAGAYAPAVLVQPPPRIEVGQTLPAGTDSVAAFETIAVKGGRAEALAIVHPGDGVLPAGADCDATLPLRQSGARLRVTDLAVLAAAGIARVTVREPRLRIVTARGSAIIAAAARLITNDIERQGGSARIEAPGADLDLVLSADSADAILVIGGTGQGRNDTSVQTLARAGRLAHHGFALTPGETAALGFVGQHPVLLLPGRLDAALAVWLTVGRRMLARLAGLIEPEPVTSATLTRKVASTVGLAEFVPVRRIGEEVEPLAAKYLPFSALTRADGWILVPAESEGYAEGGKVSVRAWP